MPDRSRPLQIVGLALALALALTLSAGTARASGDLYATANAISATQIEIQWEWYEFNPEAPALYPEWIGYDLYRRNPAECSDWVRLNDVIFPRVLGATHGGTIVDTPPAALVTWEYELRPVDIARNTVVIIGGYCEPPCVPHAWESIPKLVGPVTIGTVEMDLGWAVYIFGCPGSCWYGFYVEGEAADQLRPYLGTGDAFRFYGDESFGGFEGSALFLDRFEPADCGVVPTKRTSWGKIKTIYR
jgi:hypothetical protein